MEDRGYNLRQRPLPGTVSDQSSLPILSAITTAIGSSSSTLISFTFCNGILAGPIPAPTLGYHGGRNSIITYLQISDFTHVNQLPKMSKVRK